ncbi:MAG: ribose-phosphate pyrophosphokinase-like domain-containing protein, partial [Firmicutes bacterium]|nr:ribose-phosphate pyrophosphokinase-like domain-containing protein [Bacillota bacterium]
MTNNRRSTMEEVRAPKWPVGRLGIISMKGCEEISEAIDKYLVSWHNGKYDNKIETFILKTACPRFNSGEGKGVVYESVRGYDIYIICDVFNYGVTYKMYNMEVPMSPDDHYQDLKRVIGAIEGKARRITVIMPMLYESRQHKRTARESLDCALALKELVAMGVDDI